jgi:methylase of polypeptide subunit release factors
MDARTISTPDRPSARQRPVRARRVSRSEPELDAADQALVDLGRDLKRRGYRFMTVTPTTHARVNARRVDGPASLTDIFGWSRPFAGADLPESAHMRLADAGELETAGPKFRSRVRFSTLGDQLFVHSAFPTGQSDAVFFGPDTYRFARLLRHSIGTWKRQGGAFRIIDVGAGSGAGGIHAASHPSLVPASVTLGDVNPRALRFCRINAALNGIPGVQVIASDLFAEAEGCFDLIISNPPYLVDPLARLYRHGGGEFGFDLSLQIVEEGLQRLAPGGRLVLYTGSAIVDGIDLFHEIVCSRLAGRGVRFEYEEIDPDVFGEELEQPPYDRADRIAVIGLTIDRT